jgi:hypothetical protein
MDQSIPAAFRSTSLFIAFLTLIDHKIGLMIKKRPLFASSRTQLTKKKPSNRTPKNSDASFTIPVVSNFLLARPPVHCPIHLQAASPFEA